MGAGPPLLSALGCRGGRSRAPIDTKERVACEADHMCMCICTASERARAYFFASKKSILRVLVPVFLSVCDAKGGADMGAGMPAKGASGTAMPASLSPPG